MTDRRYRAVCFDLDGTLLPLDVDAFMKAYFRGLGAFVARYGVEPDALKMGMKAGIGAMALSNEHKPNSEIFWEAFLPFFEQGAFDWKSEVMKFYEDAFGELGKDVEPSSAMVRAVETLVAKGYPLVLTTMPMFPLPAVEWRVRWAGLDPAMFARMTTYENSTAVKPKLSYYAENLAALGVGGSDVLMVGNNTHEDLSFCQLGADAYVVTDYLIDPHDFDMNAVKHGTFEDFAAWVEQLPVCENPAQNVATGLISAQACDTVLVENGCADARASDAQAWADGFKVNGMKGQ